MGWIEISGLSVWSLHVPSVASLASSHSPTTGSVDCCSLSRGSPVINWQLVLGVTSPSLNTGVAAIGKLRR